MVVTITRTGEVTTSSTHRYTSEVPRFQIGLFRTTVVVKVGTIITSKVLGHREEGIGGCFGVVSEKFVDVGAGDSVIVCDGCN